MDFQEELQNLKTQNLYRRLRKIQGAPGSRVSIEDRTLINFSSNDYLALARDPRVRAAAQTAIDRYGVGATSSRLLSGSLTIHDELEDHLASFLGFPSALVFSSGYHVNVGLVRALADSGDVVLIDRAVHASLIDGCRLSQAKLRVFQHNDLADLKKNLHRCGAHRRIFVVTEGLFSMDGDTAPLREIRDLCDRFGAVLIVDEAHAFGVLGKGRGVSQSEGILPRVDFYVGTLSKALGSQGGFVCGASSAIDFLKNKSRSFIYTTALSPVCAAAALESLRILEEEPDRRERVLNRAQGMRALLKEAGFDTLKSSAQIVPVLLGHEQNTLSVSRRLEEAGVFVPAIRPPTVPAGMCRLRFSLIAEHEESDALKVVQALKQSCASTSWGETVIV